MLQLIDLYGNIETDEDVQNGKSLHSGSTNSKFKWGSLGFDGS